MNHDSPGWFKRLQLNKNGQGSVLIPKEVLSLLGWEKGQELWIPRDRFTHRDDGNGENVVGIIIEKPPPDTERPRPKRTRNHNGEKQCKCRVWNPRDANFCIKCGKKLGDIPIG